MKKQKTTKPAKTMSPEIYQLLIDGVKLFEAGEFKQAESVLIQILRQDKKHADANYILGIIASRLGQYDRAEKRLRKAIQLSPNASKIYNDLGLVLKQMGQLAKATESFQKAIELGPENGYAYNNLAFIYHDIGKLSEADQAYKKAIQCGTFPAFSNRLLHLNYLIDIEQTEVLEAHQDWDAYYQSNHPNKQKNYSSSKPTKRQIKVGYVSPDFNTHSVAYFFEPLLDCHDRSKFEVYCYYANTTIDETTLRFKEKADYWRSLSKLNDQQAADLIYKDGIDILVDLSGHTKGNRLGVFTHRPASIQMTWLGYPNTTGLTAIQYRLVDSVTDPESQVSHCSEQLIRLPNGFLCYRGNKNIAISPVLPSQKKDYFTFGSFNNLRKVNNQVIEAWSAILHSVPNSRLLIKSKEFEFIEVKQRLLKLFKAQGITSNRLMLIDRIESQEAHLKLYDEVDLALDTFPYNGTTTTCEALWMGVPTLTFLGDHHASRVSASILKHSGLSEFVADDLESYIKKARQLAENTEKLSALRPTFREIMLGSDLCDAQGFTDEVEKVFLQAIEKLV